MDDIGAHRGEREAPMAATATFEGSGIVVLKAHTIAVIVKAEADAGHPANTRKIAPAESAIPIRIAFCSAKKNSLRCGKRTSRAGSPFAHG